MTTRHKDSCDYLLPIKPGGIAKPCNCGAETAEAVAENERRIATYGGRYGEPANE
jgi:hypothetical protein